MADHSNVAVILDRLERNGEFISLNQHEWLNTYPEEYVVVCDEQLVAHAGTLEEALDLARGRCRDQGIKGAAFAYLNPDPVSLLL